MRENVIRKALCELSLYRHFCLFWTEEDHQPSTTTVGLLAAWTCHFIAKVRLVHRISRIIFFYALHFFLSYCKLAPKHESKMQIYWFSHRQSGGATRWSSRANTSALAAALAVISGKNIIYYIIKIFWLPVPLQMRLITCLRPAISSGLAPPLNANSRKS